MEPAKPDPDRAAESAAYQWLARRDRGLTADEKQAFDLWLAADRKNPKAVARIESVWGQMDQLRSLASQTDGGGDPDLLASRSASYHWRHSAALAAAVLILGFIVARPHFHRRSAPAEPAPADNRPLALPDGTFARLTPKARLEVQFSATERRVRLSEGQAIFQVAKNPTRPFVVSARNIEIRDIGTVFEVRLDPDRVRVSVAAGEVRAQRVAGESVLITAGHWADFPDVAPAPGDVLLVFTAQPLSEVAAEFNWHNHRQLVIGDPATGALRIGGTFRAENLDAFLRLLQTSFRVTAQRGPDGAIVLRQSD